MFKKQLLYVFFLVVFLFSIAGCGSNSATTVPSTEPGKKPGQSDRNTAGPADKATPSTLSGQLKVHFLDVGQADSILVQMPNGQNMLVDAGNNEDGDAVVKYLNNAGVKKIDYLVGTHPHEDHVGGLDTVIHNFSVGKLFMPRVTHTTKTFEDVLEAIQEKGLKITPAKAGVEIINIDKFNAVMLSPNSASYESLNNYSPVIKVTFGDVSFLFTGDAEEQSEAEMLKSEVDLKANVLKVGHHGSHSSTSPDFFKAVSPQYAVLSVGADNDYGHPHKEALQTLKGVKVYRTDLSGTIVFTTDGKEIDIKTNESKGPSDNDTATENLSGKLYVDASGQGLIKGNINSKGEKIYHLPSGAYYEQTIPEMWFKTEDEARAAGFRASKR